MEQNTSDSAMELRKEIEQLLKQRKTYITMDFSLAHLFLWASILASFASSIIIASEANLNRLVIAIIAGVPGLIILIEKSFDFSKRAMWGAMYKIELEKLRYDLVFGKNDPYKISSRLIEIQKKI